MLGDIELEDGPVEVLRFNAVIRQADFTGVEVTDRLVRHLVALLDKPSSVVQLEKQDWLAGKAFLMTLVKRFDVELEPAQASLSSRLAQGRAVRGLGRRIPPMRGVAAYQDVSATDLTMDRWQRYLGVRTDLVLGRFLIKSLGEAPGQLRRVLPLRLFDSVDFALEAETVAHGSFALAKISVYVGRNKLVTFLTAVFLAQQIFNAAPQTINVATQLRDFMMETIEDAAGPDGTIEWLDTGEFGIDWDELMWDVLKEFKRREEEWKTLKDPDPPSPGSAPGT